MDKIELRRGVQSKDSDVKEYGRRYDILTRLNQESTIPVPAHGGTLIWITFDCRDVKPGVYKGFLNIIPLSERCEAFKWSKDRKSFNANGESKKIPVELEVLPLELAKESPMPGKRIGVYVCGTYNALARVTV